MEKKFDGERLVPEECDNEMLIEHYQRYEFAKMFVRNKTVLDAACGDGYGSDLLAESAERVFGLDIEEDVVKRAEDRYRKSNLSYVVGNVSKLPFEDNTFDVVVSFETIEHINDELQKLCLNEMKRVLKNEGILIMSTPNKKVYTDLVQGKNPFHIKEFYVEEFIDFLGKKFGNLQLYYQFPHMGYFITRENEAFQISDIAYREKCRYVVAVCSNKEFHLEVDTSDLSRFDNTMYYFLNKRVHKLEEMNIKMKREVDAFEKQQEETIHIQQETIIRLENIIEEQKQYVTHLENDIQELKNYIEENEKKKSGGSHRRIGKKNQS